MGSTTLEESEGSPSAEGGAGDTGAVLPAKSENGAGNSGGDAFAGTTNLSRLRIQEHLDYVRLHNMHRIIGGLVSHLVSTRHADFKRETLKYLRGLGDDEGRRFTPHPPSRTSEPRTRKSFAFGKPDDDGVQKFSSFNGGVARSFSVQRGVNVDVGPTDDDERELLPQHKRAASMARCKSSLSVRDREPLVEKMRRSSRLGVRSEGGSSDPGTPNSLPAMSLGSFKNEQSFGSQGSRCGSCRCNEATLMRSVHPRLLDEEQAATLEFHELFHACTVCKRRPAAMLSCATMEGYCRTHAAAAYQADAKHQLWIMYDMSVYNRLYYCRLCDEYAEDNVDALDLAVDTLFNTKGTYMKEAVVDVDVNQIKGACLAVSMQGWRATQEDADILCKIGESFLVCAVLDGHGGDCASRWMAKNLVGFLASESAIDTVEDMKRAVTAAFATADEKLSDSLSDECATQGSTCCMVIVAPTYILCANIGDSRAIMQRGEGEDGVVELSVDQTLDCEEETRRIRGAGYEIRNGRIEGMLSVPRSFGDFDFKQCGGKSAAEQAVSIEPVFTHFERTPEDKFILIACDGLWDGYDNAQAAQYLCNKLFVEKKKPLHAVKALMLSNVAPEVDDEGIGMKTHKSY